MMLSILIGPVFFVLLETSIKKGAKQAILIDIGVLLSDILYLIAAYFFSESINERLEQNSYIKYVGAAIFIVIGTVSIIKKKSPQKGKTIDVDQLEEVDVESEGPVLRVRHYFALIAKGMGLNAINPGVLVYWIGASTYASEHLHLQSNQIIYYFASTLGTMFAVDVLKIYFASKLQNKLTPKTLDRMSVIVGIVLIFFGVVLCFQDFY